MSEKMIADLLLRDMYLQTRISKLNDTHTPYDTRKAEILTEVVEALSEIISIQKEILTVLLGHIQQHS